MLASDNGIETILSWDRARRDKAVQSMMHDPHPDADAMVVKSVSDGIGDLYLSVKREEDIDRYFKCRGGDTSNDYVFVSVIDAEGNTVLRSSDIESERGRGVDPGSLKQKGTLTASERVKRPNFQNAVAHPTKTYVGNVQKGSRPGM